MNREWQVDNQALALLLKRFTDGARTPEELHPWLMMAVIERLEELIESQDRIATALVGAEIQTKVIHSWPKREEKTAPRSTGGIQIG